MTNIDADNALSLNECLTQTALAWRLHNCKFLQNKAVFDEPKSLLHHYDSLSDDIKSAHPLSFEHLKRMNEPMTVQAVSELLGLPDNALKGAWHIKYVGRAVFFCESLSLAVRVHFSNTSKPSVAVYGVDKERAWSEQAGAWRFFGVVDILYKGAGQVAIESDDEPLFLTYQDSYQTLPESHSLALTHWLNEQKLDNLPELNWLWTAINERVGGVLVLSCD